MTTSVIVTVYNTPRVEWLAQCIESVLEQTTPDWQLIVMDDGSTKDDVRGYLAGVEVSGDGRVVVVRSEPEERDRYATVRYAALINEAVERFAIGDYITYLAHDDYYYPKRLEVMTAALQQRGCDVVYSCQDVIDADGGILGKRCFEGRDLKVAFDRVDHNSVLHTREVFDEVGGWPTYVGYWGGADAWFWRRLEEAGYTFHSVGIESLEAKRYHDDGVQALIATGRFPVDLG